MLSSTSKHCDKNGKRVVTTMTEIVTVNKHGKRKTETKMTMMHLDNGRRVKKEVCKEDDN